MDLLIILLASIFGMAIAALKESSKSKVQKRKPILNYVRHNRERRQGMERRHRRIHTWIELSRLRQLYRMQQTIENRRENTRFLVENWKKSIIGLVKLAEKNLRIAKVYSESGDCRRAVEVAFAGVENISRALIHCYGGKPDPGPGQEEALRLLLRRFQIDEKVAFEKAIDGLASIKDYKKVQGSQNRWKWCSTKDKALDETETRQMLDSASRILILFKQIMAEHFSPEIPELNEVHAQKD